MGQGRGRGEISEEALLMGFEGGVGVCGPGGGPQNESPGCWKTSGRSGPRKTDTITNKKLPCVFCQVDMQIKFKLRKHLKKRGLGITPMQNPVFFQSC